MTIDVHLFPRRKLHNLIEERVFDEVLVYDRTRDRAHCLNATAARVWELCDGSRTIEQITQVHTGLTEEASDDAVLLALRQLSLAHLLEEPLPAGVTEGLSRRGLLRKVGRWGIAASIPLVVTRLAPGGEGECGDDVTCPEGFCKDKRCEPRCEQDSDCGFRERCDQGECVDEDPSPFPRMLERKP